MTIDRTGLAAGLSPEPSALGMEILIALMEVQDTCDRRDGDRYRKGQIAAILRAVATSDLLKPREVDDTPEFRQMIADAEAAITAHIEELERPTSRFEDGVLQRLRAVPTRKELTTRYEDARDAERVRRRGLIGAMLSAASDHAFVCEPSDEIIIDPNNIDFENRQDFSVAWRDFLQDCARMDAGLKPIYCMVEADRFQNDLTPPSNKRDALIWAMVAIDTGQRHPKQRTQAIRCRIVAELTGYKPRTLGQYLKELRRAERPEKKPDFSEEERQLFKDRSDRVRKLASYAGAGWDLVLPVLRGWAMAALPEPSFKNHVLKSKKVTSTV